MSRHKKDPLRPLTDAERQILAQLSRSQIESAVEVTRAKILLAVARGDDYQQAARSVGRSSVDAVSHGSCAAIGDRRSSQEYPQEVIRHRLDIVRPEEDRHVLLQVVLAHPSEDP